MKLKHAYILCLFVFVLLCFLLPQSGRFDTYFWIGWAKDISVTGIGYAYTIETLNYNPVYIYVLRAYDALMGNPEAIERNINYLKIFTLLFDIGAIVLLMHWLSKNGRKYMLSFFILFNLAYLYNTLFWGQIDAIHTTLIFASAIAAFNKKPILSLALFVLALNTKTQSILFLPVLGLLWLPLIKNNFRDVIKGIAVAVLVQFIIVLPFVLKGTAAHVWHNYTGVVDFYPKVSLRAFNFWYLILWEKTDVVKEISDTTVYAGLTYNNWGFIMFCIMAVISLLPLLIKTIIKWKKNEAFAFADAEMFFLSMMLITVVFFYFPTQMHERYSHPAVLFAGIYFVLSRRWLIFLFISYAYLMNLEEADHAWKLGAYSTLAFDARLIAILYALAMFIGIYRLYKDYNIKEDWRFLTGKNVKSPSLL